jgi:hypothetical protein
MLTVFGPIKMRNVTGMTGQPSMLFVLFSILAHSKQIDEIIVRANCEITSIWNHIQFRYNNDITRLKYFL